MKFIKTAILFVTLSFLSFGSSAQTAITTQPRASQGSTVKQTLGISEIYVKYHRPAVKGREIWGKLVPYGQVWRAGANENTIIKFTKDVSIGGKELSAGAYGLHIEVGETECQVIFSNDYSAWGSFSYNPKKDALRVPSKLENSNRSQEYLSFEFENINSNSTDCALYWGDKKIVFNIIVDVHTQVLASLRDELQLQSGWSWVGWNEAANYCLTNEVNLKEGLQWANRSVFISPNSNNIITQSKIKSKMAPEGTDKKTALVKAIEQNLNSNQVSWKEWDGMAQYMVNNKLDLDKALEWSNKSIGMNTTMTNMMTKSTIYTNMGKTKEASLVVKNAIYLGTNAELNNYGYQLLFSGKTKQAVEVFEANAEKNPTDPNVFDSLGEGYLTDGQNEKAIKSFKKSLSLNPPPNVKANSIKLLKQLGINIDNIRP